MNLRLVTRGAGFAVSLFCSAVSAQTALDVFMANDDGAFDYVEYDESSGLLWRTHFLEMTSRR